MSSLSSLYVPFTVDIAAISSSGINTVVTTDEDHGFVIGNLVTFQIPQQWGMIELNGLSGFVTAITDDTVTVRLDSQAFNPFVVPADADEISPAQIIPAGDNNFGYQSVGQEQPDSISIPGAYRAPLTR